MNRTERTRSAQLLGELFDELVAPQAQSPRARGDTNYFPLTPDPNVSTYYRAPRHATLSPEDFELEGGTAEGSLTALAALWQAQGDAELLPLIPRLREVARVLSEERTESDGTVDVLCYTLF